MNDDVGGYEREHKRTFGVGTLHPCRHEAFGTLYPDGIWRGTSPAGHGFNVAYMSMAQPGDTVGTKRCLGCGNALREGKP